VLAAQGRWDDVAAVLVDVEAFPAPTNTSRVAGLRARIHAAQGDQAAVREVAELVAMVPETGFVLIKSDALVDAAEAMALLGDHAKAAEYGREALQLAEEKQNHALASQLRAFLARLRD
jgi:ATP/maltotriose-dependent transcriptional regulator MalT